MRILALLLLAAATSAAAQNQTSRDTVVKDRPATGTRIRQDLAGPTPVPINLPYDRLSPSDKAKVRERYIDLPAEDEPPYPVGGLKDVLVPITKGQQLLLASGELFVVATVGENGLVTELQVLASPSPKMTKGVANVLFNVRFKPGLCGGIPCKMEFPLHLAFTTN